MNRFTPFMDKLNTFLVFMLLGLGLSSVQKMGINTLVPYLSASS